MKKILYSLLAISILLISINWKKDKVDPTVSAILQKNGATIPQHFKEKFTETQIQQGKELVIQGRTKYQGKKSRPISKHFTCVTCHNTVKETDNLKFANSAQQRLDYAYKTGIPFLQGSTFFGIVNREKWYNGDYQKKYGKLVDSARNDLGAAIQLCAQECSQGRVLEQWEEDAILAYFRSLELKISDLTLPSSLIDSIQENLKITSQRLQEFYPLNSPATFTTPDQEKPFLAQLTGDYNNGRKIYEVSCKTCHKPNGVSFLILDDSKLTKQAFIKNLGSYKDADLHQITRWGTYPHSGHKPYMPNYTLEKLSHQQLKDLETYLTTIE